MMDTRPGHARWALDEWTVFLIDHHQDSSFTEHPPHGKDILHLLHPSSYEFLQSYSHLPRGKLKIKECVILPEVTQLVNERTEFLVLILFLFFNLIPQPYSFWGAHM